MKKKIRVHDIEWVDDGEEIDLPNEVEMEVVYEPGDNLSETISDKLSDEYGFLVDDFTYDFRD